MRAWISNSFALGLHQSFGATCADMGEDVFRILRDGPSAACRLGIIINVPIPSLSVQAWVAVT